MSEEHLWWLEDLSGAYPETQVQWPDHPMIRVHWPGSQWDGYCIYWDGHVLEIMAQSSREAERMVAAVRALLKLNQ